MWKSVAVAVVCALWTTVAVAQQPDDDGRGRSYPDGHGGTVYFPLGDLSFADAVVSLQIGRPMPVPGARDAEQALHPPDLGVVENPKFVTLGCRGTLTLRYVDNAIVDLDGPDLYVFEFGPAIEPTTVWISADGIEWIDVGQISGDRADIDIAPHIPPGGIYRYVRLRDLATDCGGDRPGADVDAVGAIGSGLRITIDGSVLFGFDQVDLRPEAQGALDAVATQFDSIPGARIVIIGHTDSVGSESYNRDLSMRRAEAVSRYFNAVYALDGYTLEVRGEGEGQRIVSNATEVGRARNRRVEIAVIPPPDAATPPAPADTASAQATLAGNWTGTYRCVRGVSVGRVAWTVTKRPDGAIEIDETWWRGGDTGTVRYAGTFDSDANRLAVVESSGRYKIEAVLYPADGAIAGDLVGHASCDTVSLARQ